MHATRIFSLRYVGDRQDKTVIQSFVNNASQWPSNACWSFGPSPPQAYSSHFAGWHRAKSAAPLFSRAKSCQVKPPDSPFAQGARFQKQALQALAWGKRQASASVLPVLSLAWPFEPQADVTRKPARPVRTSNLACNSATKAKWVWILVTVLGGTKKDCGNRSPIDATRSRKLSSSLLPHAPRPSQLCPGPQFDMPPLRLLTAEVVWR